MLKITFVLIVLIIQNALSEPSSKVLGGYPTTIDRYPILAQMLLASSYTANRTQYTQYCTGVILTVKHIISTAHCYQFNKQSGMDYSDPKYWKVRVGSTFRNHGGNVYNVKSIIPHELFDIQYHYNDVAVIVLRKRLTLSPTVRQGTIAKPGVELPNNGVCILLGWGTTMVGQPQPDQLQQANVNIIDPDTCNSRYSSIRAVITPGMICAGKLGVSEVDACYGDSGGPLVYSGLVVGLVSFGYSCGHPYYPGVYTKIAHYSNWITKTVSKNS